MSMPTRPHHPMLSYKYIKMLSPNINKGPSTSNPGPSNNNNQDNNTNNITYKNVPLNYETLITHIGQAKPHVSMIHVKGKEPQCVVTTHHTRITVPRASALVPSPPVSSQYNILYHLGKTTMQISILGLLKSSPIYQEILTKALKDAYVPNDIDPTQFQALVGHLSSTYQLIFSQNDMPIINSNHNRPI